MHAAEHPEEIEGRRYPDRQFAVGQSVPLVISVCTEPKLLDTPVTNSATTAASACAAVAPSACYRNSSMPQTMLSGESPVTACSCASPAITAVSPVRLGSKPIWSDCWRENQAEFSVLWLLLHASRFGAEGQPVSDCILEQWRNGCRDQGTLARNLLRRNVEQIGWKTSARASCPHPANTMLREALGNGSNRLVYRLIFLLTVEERGILHPPGSAESAKGLFSRGYSLKRLRDKAVRRSAHDRNHDQWEGLRRVWLGLAEGEPRLALPALGGNY